MKNLMLVFILVGQLVLSPVAWSLTQADCKAGKIFNSKTGACEDCAQGTIYNSTTNTCDVRQDVSELQGETQECMKLESTEKQKECMEAAAKTQLDDSGLEASDVNGSKISAIAAGISVGLGTLAFVGSDTRKCAVRSVQWIKAAAITNAASELLTLWYYTNRLNSLNEEFDELTMKPKTEDEKIDDKNKRGVNLQDKAFEYLIEQEKHFKAVGNIKGSVYAATGAMYATAGVYALTEQTQIVTAAATAKATCAAADAASVATAGSARAACDSAKLAYQNTLKINTCNSPESNNEQKKLEENAEEKFKEPTKQDIRAAKNQDLRDEVNKNIQEVTDKNPTGFTQKNTGMISLASAVGFGFLMKTLKNNAPKQSALPFENELMVLETMVYQKYSFVNYFWSKIITRGIHLALAETDAAKNGILAEMQKEIGKLRNLLLKPLSRAAVAGAMTAASTALSIHAFKEAKKADKRMDYLEGVRKDFAKTAAPAIAPCTTEDRGNPLKPMCYCYAPEGGKNGERQKSQVCKKQWNENPSLAERGEYEEKTVNAPVPKLCISVNNTADFGCRCKDEKTGKNKCKFISPSSAMSGIRSNALKNSITDANSLFSGDYGGGELSAQKSREAAIGLLKASKKLAKDNGLEKELAPLQKQVDSMFANPSPTLSGAFEGAFAGSSTNSLASLNPELKKDIEKKLGDEFKAIGVEYMSPTGKTAAAADDGFSFNLDDSGGGTSIETTSIEEVDTMNAKYDIIQNSDIDQRSDSNLFDILSLRYQKSGLRHIFGKKEEQERLDDAANTDINQ
ncbi:MAG: hypothetical protein JNM93_06010 [Bacteriovoracaceae bacterium]|nr:hypothetical protein [Bacteriovoracaceae bacterium]